MTPAHPLSALVEQLVKAVAVEVRRLEAAEPVLPGLIDSVAIGKRVGRTSKTVKRWMRTGVIPGRYINGRWYCTTADFEKFLAKRSRANLKIA